LSTLEKIFLTFKPVSIIGFLLLISFYAILMFSSLMFIGMFVDDAGNFSTDIFIENILDPAISIALLVAILLLLLFRWLAVREYKHKST
jgi:xanthine/uracil permease